MTTSQQIIFGTRQNLMIQINAIKGAMDDLTHRLEKLEQENASDSDLFNVKTCLEHSVHNTHARLAEMGKLTGELGVARALMNRGE